MNSSPSQARDAVILQLRRIGIADADDAMVARAMELQAAGAEQLARLHRDFDKSVEPTHIFSVPR